MKYKAFNAIIIQYTAACGILLEETSQKSKTPAHLSFSGMQKQRDLLHVPVFAISGQTGAISANTAERALKYENIRYLERTEADRFV